MGSAPSSRGPEVPEVVRADRRWLLGAIFVFAASIFALAGLRWLYQVTGPHPEVTLFVRRLKATARRLLPRFRRARGA